MVVDIETDASEHNDGLAPGLAGVPETMLWALHNRVCEAKRHDTVLIDPDSIRIYEAIDYDCARHFGNPDGSLAVRAAEIDLALRKWLKRHPDGFVVSLWAGLETQVRRVDNGCVRWLSVDLPDAIRLREHFIIPTGRGDGRGQSSAGGREGAAAETCQAAERVVTISLGVASMEPEINHVTADDLLEAADQALYRSKQGGATGSAARPMKDASKNNTIRSASPRGHRSRWRADVSARLYSTLLQHE